MQRLAAERELDRLDVLRRKQQEEYTKMRRELRRQQSTATSAAPLSVREAAGSQFFLEPLTLAGSGDFSSHVHTLPVSTSGISVSHQLMSFCSPVDLHQAPHHSAAQTCPSGRGGRGEAPCQAALAGRQSRVGRQHQ